MKASVSKRNYIENASAVAAACGCNRSTLYRCLRGPRTPSAALRARIEACGLALPKRLRIPKGV